MITEIRNSVKHMKSRYLVILVTSVLFYGCGGNSNSGENNVNSPYVFDMADVDELIPLTNKSFDSLSNNELRSLYSTYAEMLYDGQTDLASMDLTYVRWITSKLFGHHRIPTPILPYEFYNLIPSEIDNSLLPLEVNQIYKCPFGGTSTVEGGLNESGVGRFRIEYVNCRVMQFMDQSGVEYLVLDSLSEFSSYYEDVTLLLVPDYTSIDECNCSQEYVVSGVREFRSESSPYALEETYTMHVENRTETESYLVNFVSSLNSSPSTSPYQELRHQGYIANSEYGIAEFFTGMPFENSVMPSQGELTFTGNNSEYIRLSQLGEDCLEVKQGAYDESVEVSILYYFNIWSFSDPAYWELSAPLDECLSD